MSTRNALPTLFAGIVLIALHYGTSDYAHAAPLRMYAAPDEPQTRSLLDALYAQSPTDPTAEETIELVLMESRTLVERAIGEHRRSGRSADLLLVPDAMSAAALAQAGVLLAYPGADITALDRRFIDPDKRYFPTRLVTIGIAFNRSARARPTDWQELTKGIAPETIAWPSPQSSAMAALLMATLSRTDRVGWNLFRHLAFMGVQPVADELVAVEALVNGQVEFAIVPDYMAVRAHADGAPIHFANPRNGSPVLTFPIGIGSGTPRLAAAHAFVDHMLSKAGQRQIAAQGFRPMHRRVRPKPQFPAATSLKLLVLDETRALAEQDKDLQRFQKIFAER